MNKPTKIKEFEFTTTGYNKAKKYLKKIGKWEDVSTKGFSTDGWSIITAANHYLSKEQ